MEKYHHRMVGTKKEKIHFGGHKIDVDPTYIFWPSIYDFWPQRTNGIFNEQLDKANK